MVDFFGWLMPVQYTSIVDEHRATRTSAGLFDISHMGRFRFDGPGAGSFLDRLLTRRVADMSLGSVRYSLMTNINGGVLDDVLLYVLDGRHGPFHLLVVNAGNRQKISNWIQTHISNQGGADGSGVEFTDETTASAMIAVQGPAASAAVVSVVDAKLTELAYYTAACADVAGYPGIVSRTGYTGEDGYELIVPAPAAEEVWQTVLTAGQAGGALPVGLGARDTLRLEAAMPLYGHELSEAIDPYQAGLGFAVQLKDRQFVGRDALVQLRQRSDLPRRVGLELAGRRVPRQGYPVVVHGEPVGEVTSGTFSPTLERPIAMAYVRPEIAAMQTQVEVDIRGRMEPARIVSLPFYHRPAG
jgi:aminomethyltransferase